MNKTLVTGGTGFLGSHLIRALLGRGEAVRATRRAGSRARWLTDIDHQIDWVEADITDLPALEEAFSQVEKVYHCAAVVSFHPRDAHRMMHTNVEGTANVVNLSLDFGVKKLVHVSSIAAIGRSPQRQHLDEKSVWVEGALNTRYAESKYRAEMEVWRGHAEGLSVGVVNPAIILGHGDWHSGSNRFFQQVYDGLKFYPVGRSGFVDVADVVRFMILLMDSEISGERYILNAENLTYKDFLEKVAHHLKVPPPQIRVKPWLAEVAWRVEWLKEKLLGTQPMVTRETARTSSHHFFYDNRKSLSVFNFSYRSLDETVRAVAHQFLNEKQVL